MYIDAWGQALSAHSVIMSCFLPGHCPVPAGNPLNGSYNYLNVLLPVVLHHHCPYAVCHSPAPTGGGVASVPLPDRGFSSYLAKGISHGFRIGFDWSKHSLRPSFRNMSSTNLHSSTISSYIVLALELINTVPL